jgi:hypothetical protein
VIGEAGFHGRGNAKRAVDSHEVVIGKVQGKCGVMILPLFAESVRQSSESANLHTHGQVLALDMAGANLIRVGIADDWYYLR